MTVIRYNVYILDTGTVIRYNVYILDGMIGNGDPMYARTPIMCNRKYEKRKTGNGGSSPSSLTC